VKFTVCHPLHQENLGSLNADDEARRDKRDVHDIHNRIREIFFHPKLPYDAGATGRRISVATS
jgi:hypothetical protein